MEFQQAIQQMMASVEWLAYGALAIVVVVVAVLWVQARAHAEHYS